MNFLQGLLLAAGQQPRSSGALQKQEVNQAKKKKGKEG
jgi:hypothetical protein